MTDEDMAEVRRVNNNLRGTEFSVESPDGDSPVRRGVITIDQAVLRFVVYPEKVSRNGRKFFPVRLQYMPDCGYVLKSVPVRGKVMRG